MSQFLHSTAWERFQKAAGTQTGRHLEQLYIERPGKGFSYWLGSRISIHSTFSIPSFAHQATFLRIEPLDAESLSNLERFTTSTGLKLVPTIAVQPRQTILVDLAPSYEDILKAMKQKHRYNIKV